MRRLQNPHRKYIADLIYRIRNRKDYGEEIWCYRNDSWNDHVRNITRKVLEKEDIYYPI